MSDLLNREFSDMVNGLAKSGEKICEQLEPGMAHLWHMATGISGEAGELLDAIKKSAIYNKDLDIQNVIEELGDLEFYMEGMRQHLAITREEVLHANMKKLSKRYPNFKYTDKAAHERADKA